METAAKDAPPDDDDDDDAKAQYKCLSVSFSSLEIYRSHVTTFFSSENKRGFHSVENTGYTPVDYTIIQTPELGHGKRY